MTTSPVSVETDSRRPQGPVLVVDDHDEIREMVRAYLEMEGFSVCTAWNGLEALKCLERRPCLILLDVSMPGMDGITFTHELRQHPDPGLATTPIVLLTAAWDTDKAMRATGARAAIRKPSDPRYVLQIVERFCRP